MKGDLIGKRVEVEGEGVGSIFDETENMVWITLDGRPDLMCVPKTALNKLKIEELSELEKSKIHDRVVAQMDKEKRLEELLLESIYIMGEYCDSHCSLTLPELRKTVDLMDRIVKELR